MLWVLLLKLLHQQVIHLTKVSQAIKLKEVPSRALCGGREMHNRKKKMTDIKISIMYCRKCKASVCLFFSFMTDFCSMEFTSFTFAVLSGMFWLIKLSQQALCTGVLSLF